MEDIPWWLDAEITSGMNSKDMTWFYWISTLCKLSPQDFEGVAGWSLPRAPGLGSGWVPWNRQSGWAGAGVALQDFAGAAALPWLSTFLFVLPTNDLAQTDEKASAVLCCCPIIYQFHHWDRKMCSAKAAPYLCWLQKPQCISLHFLDIDFQKLFWWDGILQISKQGTCSAFFFKWEKDELALFCLFDFSSRKIGSEFWQLQIHLRLI